MKLNLHSLTKQTSVVAATKVLSLVLSLLTLVLLARYLGAADYGRYSFILSVGAIMSIPLQFGLPIMVLRTAVAARINQSWVIFNGILNFAAKWILVGSLTVLVVACLIGSVTESSYIIWAGFVVGLLIFFSAHSAVRSAAIRGLGCVVRSQIPEMVVRPLFILIGVLVLIYLNQLELKRVIAAYLIAAAIAFTLGAFLLNQLKRRYAVGQDKQSDYRQWLKSMLPLGFVGAAAQVNGQIDVVFIGALLTPEQVGIYKIAALAALQVSFATWAVNAVFSPELAAAFQARSSQMMMSLLRQSIQLMLLVGIFIFVILALFGKPMIRLIIGEEYVQAYVPMMILAVGQLFMLSSGPVGTMLAMCNKEKDMARASALAVTVNLLLNPIAILAFGILGAATATAVSGVVWRLALARSAKRFIASLDGIEEAPSQVQGTQ